MGAVDAVDFGLDFRFDVAFDFSLRLGGHDESLLMLDSRGDWIGTGGDL